MDSRQNNDGVPKPSLKRKETGGNRDFETSMRNLHLQRRVALYSATAGRSRNQNNSRAMLGARASVVGLPYFHNQAFNITPSKATIEYYHTNEMSHWVTLNARYMENQPYFTHYLRSKMINWMVFACGGLNMSAKTLHLAVNYFDRYLSQCTVGRGVYKCVGIIALFIAAKLQEVMPPKLEEFINSDHRPYLYVSRTKRIEMHMLNVLEFNLWQRTACDFVYLYCAAVSDMSVPTICFTLYLIELLMLDGEQYIKYKGSLIAASAFVLARHTMYMPLWSAELQCVSELQLDDLGDLVIALSQLQASAAKSEFRTIFTKYGNPMYMSVSYLRRRPICDKFAFNDLAKSYTPPKPSKRARFGGHE